MGLHLFTQSFGPIALASAPPGSIPSFTEFTFTSSGGPVLHPRVLRRTGQPWRRAGRNGGNYAESNQWKRRDPPCV